MKYSLDALESSEQSLHKLSSTLLSAETLLQKNEKQKQMRHTKRLVVYVHPKFRKLL